MTKYCNDAEIVDRDDHGARGIFLRALLDGALILSGEIVGMPTTIHPKFT